MKDFQVKSIMVMKLLYELFYNRATYNLLNIEDVIDFYADIREEFDCGNLLESLNVHSPEDMRMMLIYYNDYETGNRSEEDLLGRVFEPNTLEGDSTND